VVVVVVVHCLVTVLVAVLFAFLQEVVLQVWQMGLMGWVEMLLVVAQLLVVSRLG
jgi:hypothetical protein